MAVTVRDVAALAGVSPTVVSKVLNNRAKTIRVSEATSQRVRDAAAQLGYRINILGRSFRQGQTSVIGILHNQGATRPYFDRGSRYFAALTDGIMTGAFKHGYSVMFCPKLLGENPLDAMSDGRFDGLLWYCGHWDEEMHKMLLSTSVPIGLIHTPSELLGGRFPSVTCDNAQGIRLAIDHLISLGHRRIAFIKDDASAFHEAQFREDAFCAEMIVRGLPFEETRDIITISYEHDNLDEVVLRRRGHTGYICLQDALAADILKRCLELNVCVPQELSVIGFDSTGFCNELQPRLTSIRQPLALMGEMAADLLIEAISKPTIPPLQQVVPCEFDIRNSTARPPSGF